MGKITCVLEKQAVASELLSISLPPNTLHLFLPPFLAPSQIPKYHQKKRTATANKSTQTWAFDADVDKQCNVCLGNGEKGNG